MKRSIFYPQVWKHTKQGIVEIRYKDRVEVYELKSKDSEVEGQDEDYYRSNGFKRVQSEDE